MNALLRPIVAMMAMGAATAAYATLQPRNLGGDAAPEAYYDTLLNISWLTDAKGGASFVTWETAVSYAANLNVYGVTGWRLPKHIDTGKGGCNPYSAPPLPGGTDCGYRPDVNTGEMAHLYYVTLGNKSWPDPGWLTVNKGPFLNLDGRIGTGGAEYWWYGDKYKYGANAWTFKPAFGTQAYTRTDLPSGAWAVHDGDVGLLMASPVALRSAAAIVPEPETYALMVFGLGLLALARRRRAR